MFSKVVFVRVENVGILSSERLTLYHTIPTFNDPEKEAFENIAGTAENAGNQHFLSFSCNVFYPFQKEFLFLSYIDFVIF